MMGSCNSEEKILQIWDINALLTDYFLTKSEQFEPVYQCQDHLHGIDLHYS